MRFPPIKYQICDEAYREIYIEARDTRGEQKEWRWAIVKRGCCLNTDMEWEWEPLPSSRTDDFFGRTRFTLSEAKKMAKRFLIEEKKRLSP